MSDTQNDPSVPEWEQRFRAARVSLPDWAEDAPDRSLFVSNATGTYELYAWDRATGEQRQVTDRPNGTTDGVLTPDGEAVWWFADTDGDEFGVWMRQPFGGGADEPAAPGLEPSYPAGLAIGRDGTAVVGRSTDEDGTTVHLVRPGSEPVVIYRHRESAGVGDLSHDGSLIALEHTEHGDAMHSALRVVRPDGSTVAELDDTEGGTKELGLSVLGFAPVAGDTRLLVGHQRRGRWEPMIWDPVTGTETDLPVDLPGDVGAEWYPDGSALLIEHGFEARSELWRYEPGAKGPVRVETPAGTVSGATARPDGTVEYLWSSAAQPPAVRATTGAVVLDPPGAKAPASVPVQDAWVDGPGGRIHALVQTPATGDGPFPTIFEIHGGPTWHDSDAFASGPAAWVDHGFAVVRVNYRGSTGYGRAWTDALKHRVGLIELEDIAAVRDWAVKSGLADPARLVLMRRLVGRLSDPARARHAAGLLGAGTGGGPGRGLRHRVPRRDGGPEGDGPHTAGRDTGGSTGSVRGVVPADVRGCRARAGLHLGGSQRPALPHPPGGELRGPPRRARRRPRGVPVRRGARLARRGGADQAGPAGARFRAEASGAGSRDGQLKRTGATGNADSPLGGASWWAAGTGNGPVRQG